MSDLRKYIPTAREKGDYRGPLSTLTEYHALGVGFATRLAGRRVFALVVLLGLLGQLYDTNGHIRDAGKELGYVALGAFLAGLYRRLR
jgi:hypothetical protein